MKIKTKKAFTLAEALIVIVIIGIISALYNISIKVVNTTQKGFEVKSQKMLENIDQVFNFIFAHHSESFNLTDLHDNSGNFSITDKDVTPRLANLFRKYLSTIDLQDGEENQVKAYYASTIIDYDKSSTGLTLNKTYSDFITTGNGVIYGFRLYKSCSAKEVNASTPMVTGNRRTIAGICGSIFYDVNGYAKPNKLGSDQYIVPFDEQGAKIKK